MTSKRRIDRLIFVFNAGSGSFNAFLDSARKLLQIKGCTLCTITHGLAGEKSEWKECKEEIGVPVDYVHKDEITPALARVLGDGDANLPCVVAEAGGELILLLGPDVLDRCKGSVADLKGRLGVFSTMKGLELPQSAVE
ncbi:MAG TPA: hypothetical protein VH988_05255 [Thermoanaerobaculia bacterium]|jgi:hypothetical protein|nr:hypothetical protein [Thermoanaerobaculia bacterium]